MKLICFNNEEEYIKEFINITKKLYSTNNNMEDEKTIRDFLTNNHSLSKYFSLNKFLVYKDDDVVGRFVITEYPDDKNICYLGFFECINDRKVSKFLFDEAAKFAKKKKYKKIIGPVDASFWNKYRLKINNFDRRPYTGEPYNLDYYYDLFIKNNYRVIDHYVSNYFDKKNYTYTNENYDKHYEEFTKLGYEIIEPKAKDFDKCLEDVYDMIIKLYSDFPVFKDISRDDFIEVFSNYKKIINMSMVRMAYYKKRAVGFFISIPNYNNIVYNLSLKNMPKLLKIKRNPQEYVMLYMGVLKEHKGLGKAIVYEINEELKRQRKSGIGALMHDGKITQKYSQDIIDLQYEYVLLERDI